MIRIIITMVILVTMGLVTREAIKAVTTTVAIMAVVTNN